MTPYLFEICTSTHYGHMVMVDDDTAVLFGDLDEELEYIEY
jgi:propane monooxygenase coupling protein